jgi:excisionase family DNA binding protein
MKKKAFTTSDIARISQYSRETIKRWLEKGVIKGYRIGTSGHWRVSAEDLAVFLKDNNIPFPTPETIDTDPTTLKDTEILPTFCWEYFKNKTDHVCYNGRCENCLVYKTKSINCYALRKEVGHKKIFCCYSCEDCEYFHFQKKFIEPKN